MCHLLEDVVLKLKKKMNGFRVFWGEKKKRESEINVA